MGGDSIRDFGLVKKSTEFSLVSPDGTLGAWQLGAPMLHDRFFFDAVFASGYIYAIGGDAYEYDDGANSSYTATVERSKVATDGSLDTWEMVTPLLAPRSRHAAFVHGNYIYVLGGSQPAGLTATIERTTIQSDGSLGSWKVIGEINTPQERPTITIEDGYLYILGGYVVGKMLATVERAQLNDDGSLGPWESVNLLNEVRFDSAAVAHNGYIYVIGGRHVLTDDNLETAEWAATSALGPPFSHQVSINQGALFTNQIDVKLQIRGSHGTQEMQVSNDGGFAGALWESCTVGKAWQITQYGNYILPRIVYIRYRDADGAISPVFQDDILLDVKGPTGQVKIELPSIAHQLRRSAQDERTFLPVIVACASECSLANTPIPLTATPVQSTATSTPVPPATPNNIDVILSLTAQDDVSGVADMMISHRQDFTGAAWEPFAPTKAWSLSVGESVTVYVRFRDNAGNLSNTVQDTISLP
ncbi:MAG: hypothetical protein KDE53_07655 [Caldilineaceae bacterium]|nr:hypothetical protein [Caldilineaceae bacterium]